MGGVVFDTDRQNRAEVDKTSPVLAGKGRLAAKDLPLRKLRWEGRHGLFLGEEKSLKLSRIILC